MVEWFIIGSVIGLLVGLLAALFQRGQHQATKIALHITEKKLQDTTQEHHHKTRQNEQLREQVVHLEATRKNLLEQAERQNQEVASMGKKLFLQFSHVSNEILETKSEKLTKQNKDQLESLLLPLREKIEDFQKQIAHTKEASMAGTMALKEEFQKVNAIYEKIHQESKKATEAILGNNKLQGTWGEVNALHILERTGLRKNEQYFIQKSFVATDGKRCIPDILIKLPDKRHIIMDVKVSLLDYVKFFNATDTKEKQHYLKKHLSSIKTHIRQLSGKNYAQAYDLSTIDFVLLLLPVEAAFSLAIQQEPSLFEEAYTSNIVLVSPTTLRATLSIIEHVWKVNDQNQHAAEIARQSGALYDKFANLVEDFKKLGHQLHLSQKSYDQALKRLASGRGNLIQKVEHLKKLGARATTNKDLVVLQPLELKSE